MKHKTSDNLEWFSSEEGVKVLGEFFISYQEKNTSTGINSTMKQNRFLKLYSAFEVLKGERGDWDLHARKSWCDH